MRERVRIPLESRVSTPVVWLLAVVLGAIGCFIVLRVHHAVSTGQERLLDRVAMIAAAHPGELAQIDGVDLAIVAADGRVVGGRLPGRLTLADRSRLGRTPQPSIVRRGELTYAVRAGRRAGRDVVVVAASRLPQTLQRRLLEIEAEGLVPIGLVALGLAVLGLERAARRHRRRLERLGRVAAQLDRGELDARTGERAGDELGGVGVQLDTLADRLQRLERSRGTTLSQVSHDLRSPLALIRAYAWTLRRSEQAGVRSDRLQTIEDEAERISQLVDDLLLLGRRSAAAPVAGSPVAADVAALAARVVEQRVSHALDAGLSLELDARGGAALVCIRAGGVERIVSNLIDNALRHAASRVVVRIEQEGSDVVLCCEDDGPGIPAAEIAHLFEPFWRGVAGPGASGLGLAIARDLVEACDGRIEAQNLPGGGASLIVRLPLAETLVGTT